MTDTKLSILAYVLLITISVLFSCSSGNKKANPESEHKESIYQLETFKVNDGWGYTIKVHGVAKYQQKRIPAAQGNSPFRSELEAQIVGELAIKKLRIQNLPTITIHELDSLQIRY
jgi:hypothetical protein